MTVALPPLLRVEKLTPASTRVILEPCAGTGNLVLPLRSVGFEVIASDISDRGCPDCKIADFFDLVRLPAGCDTLLTNPPFYCVEQFVRHALALRRTGSCCCCAWRSWKRDAAPTSWRARTAEPALSIQRGPMMTSVSEHVALNALHARIKTAIADVPAGCHPSHVVSVIVDLLAWLIVRTAMPESIEPLTAEIVRSLYRRVAHYRDQAEKLNQGEFAGPSSSNKETVQ